MPPVPCHSVTVASAPPQHLDSPIRFQFHLGVRPRARDMAGGGHAVSPTGGGGAGDFGEIA
jgi:hypothetical protein